MTVQLRQTGRERLELFAQVGVRLVDDLTSAPPIGRTQVFLDIDDNGTWRDAMTSSIVNPGGVYAWVNLEQRDEVVGQPTRKYRVRVRAQYYRPIYSLPGGELFDVHPWNDSNPPASVNKLKDIQLVPAANYSFPPHLPVIRGVVTDATGTTVVDATVSQSNKSRVLTDERGVFAIPLRQAAPGVAIAIDAVKNTMSGTINVTLPDDLGKNQPIPIA